jgi:integrase
MAFLRRDKGGNYLVSFRWAGVAYNRSLDTRDTDLAEAGLARVDEALTLLKRGRLVIPQGADPGLFIKSGGILMEVPGASEERRTVTLRELFDRFAEQARSDPKTKVTTRIHHAHVAKLLGGDTAVDSITLVDVQRYCDLRAKETWHGRPIGSPTIRKELHTFRQTWEWGSHLGHVTAPAWQLRNLTLGKDQGREPFRTRDEIERRIKRGGLKDEEVRRLWECLYLTGEEIRKCLEHVRLNGTAPFVYPMMAFVAMTGCRRAEMLRSCIDDIDFEQAIIHIREKKRDTSKEFTMRAVDMHSLLAAVLSDWLKAHPGGQHTFVQEDGRLLTENMATDHLNRTLAQDETWTNVPGFHTFRHSFASILACKGVDQRIIDALMGHQTDEMRKRYQHLFPKSLKRAVEELLT